MKERPILFSAPMVRAILDGRKTQTRRTRGLESLSDRGDFVEMRKRDDGVWVAVFRDNIPDDPVPLEIKSPYGGPGDRLWGRETWQAWQQTNVECDGWEPITRETRFGVSWAEWVELNGRPSNIEYRADSSSLGPWTPSIHMPRWASRITLEVTGVRVERLQAITHADAVAEGIEKADAGPTRAIWWRDYTDPTTKSLSAQGSYFSLWESINGEGSVAADPWVWVVSFKPLAAGISPTE